MDEPVYKDEHYTSGMISYDGELIDIKDALKRFERDKNIQDKYKVAEEKLDKEQMTFDDVKQELEENNSPWFDPSIL